MPYSQSWNFGVQHDLPGSVLLEVNYVGSRGTRLLRLVDGNPPQPALVAQLLADGVPPQALQFNNLWFGAESGSLPFDARLTREVRERKSRLGESRLSVCGLPRVWLPFGYRTWGCVAEPILVPITSPDSINSTRRFC
jgi:hypothetical protein